MKIKIRYWPDFGLWAAWFQRPDGSKSAIGVFSRWKSAVEYSLEVQAINYGG